MNVIGVLHAASKDFTLKNKRKSSVVILSRVVAPLIDDVCLSGCPCG